MKGRILTSDLKRLVQNTKIYSIKTSSTKGDSLWIKGALTLRAVSSDDYTILTDTADIASPGGAEYNILSRGALDDLSEWLSEYKDDYYDLEALPPFLNDQDSLDILTEADRAVFETDHYGTPDAGTFAISPSKLVKLRLIKPGTYPIDLRAFTAPSGPFKTTLGFRAGPTVRGLIAPLDRDGLKELYSGEELWS